MTLVLTIDPARDISDIIVRLANAHLAICAVDTVLNLIHIEATFEDMALVGPIPGVISVNLDQAAALAAANGIYLNMPMRSEPSTGSHSDLDDGFFHHTIN